MVKRSYFRVITYIHSIRAVTVATITTFPRACPALIGLKLGLTGETVSLAELCLAQTFQVYYKLELISYVRFRLNYVKFLAGTICLQISHLDFTIKFHIWLNEIQ